MKKQIAGLVTTLTFALTTAQAFADDLCPSGGFSSLCKIDPANNGQSFIMNILQIALVLAALAALAFLIYGGIKWTTSGGDKAKVGEARAMLTAAIVGLIVTFLSFFILSVVTGIFGLDSKSIFTIPRLVNN